MTVEEIKETYSMRSVLERYGIKVRNGFCNCPLHTGDRTASFKVYEDSFYCYGCNAGGDIFAFVQAYLHCDFKTAFMELGGSYKRPESLREKRQQEQTKKKLEAMRLARIKAKEEARQQMQYIGAQIEAVKSRLETAEIFSDEWTMLTNMKEDLFEIYDYLAEGGEINGELRASSAGKYLQD